MNATSQPTSNFQLYSDVAVFCARKNTNLFVGSRQVYGMIIMEVALGVFYTVKCLNDRQCHAAVHDKFL